MKIRALKEKGKDMRQERRDDTIFTILMALIVVALITGVVVTVRICSGTLMGSVLLTWVCSGLVICTSIWGVAKCLQ